MDADGAPDGDPTRERDGAATGWIACPLADPAPVEALRDELYGWLGAPEPYRREDRPHVSLFGFRLPRREADAFERSVETLGGGVGAWEGRVTGYHLWPSTRNPMVLTLDVPFPLEALASPLADALARRGGEREWGPTRPHVTLMKGGVRGEQLQWAQVDDETRRRLRAVADTERDAGGAYEPPRRLVDPAFAVRVEPPVVEWN